MELVHTYLTVSHPADVELYRDIYRRLWSAAIGPDAVNLIQGIAAELRG